MLQPSPTLQPRYSTNLNMSTSATATAERPHTRLPVPASLRAAAQQAQALQRPLVLMVTIDNCAFCELVRNNYLLPLNRTGELHALQINMLDRHTALQDFQGQSSNARALTRLWGVRIAPPLLFFDTQGREVAQRLEGIAVPEFYGAYLEQRLAQARAAMAQAR